MLTRQIIQRTIVAVAAATILTGIVASTPASASITDPVLYATVQSPYAPSCSYAANLQWDRSTSHLGGSVWLQNHTWFGACRIKVVLTLVDDEGNPVTTTEIFLPTGCGTMDPTCPSGSMTPIDQTLPVSRYAIPYVDHMDAAIVDRSR